MYAIRSYYESVSNTTIDEMSLEDLEKYFIERTLKRHNGNATVITSYSIHYTKLYDVAIWFYIATIITVAMLYIVNHLSIPTSFLHSYPVFAGVQDGLVQWWYGHNAVAFFLTTPILGIMYYFVPKAVNRLV